MPTYDDAPLESVEFAVDAKREISELTEKLDAASAHESMLVESLADAQLALEDIGWQRIGAESAREFSRDGILSSAKLCRVYAIVNPLARRAVSLRTAYIWGMGWTVQARSKGPTLDNPTAQDVNTLVQSFMDDPGNKSAYFGPLAVEQRERTLATDGNFYLALFTSPVDGRVQARTVSLDEVTDVIRNPDDKDDPWFYERSWVEESVTLTSLGGQRTSVERKAYHPAVGYWPKVRVKSIDGFPVVWDAPILAMEINGLDGWRFGIGDLRSSLPWLRGYKEFLEDWRILVKALSKFAWQVTAKSKAGRANVREKLTTTPTVDAFTGVPQAAGATAITAPDQTLEAVPKTGATIDSGSGRPLAAMIAAGMDVPVTMLLGDPGITGARATAETLDQPMQLAMQMRRTLHADFARRLFGYVIDQAVKAPRGPLKGTVIRDPFTDRETITLAGDTDRTVDIDFPDLAETPVDLLVRAIVEADGTGKLPPLLVAQELMTALGVESPDEWLEQLTDDQGQFMSPEPAAANAAIAAFRAGQDPASAAFGQAGDGATGEQSGPDAVDSAP